MLYKPKDANVSLDFTEKVRAPKILNLQSLRYERYQSVDAKSGENLASAAS